MGPWYSKRKQVTLNTMAFEEEWGGKERGGRGGGIPDHPMRVSPIFI